ncbi:hypothetical protein ANN_21417 [Periplaneta americana]|uniref:HAT C-terminal dimerisation domain-containing protein n=1 Tax=Periplaneta americana TaxID=6978 RepID=A0ABQ8SF93_PERAM|nr:hypothetical protein ANN_21417 [Periplaneta americana]
MKKEKGLFHGKIIQITGKSCGFKVRKTLRQVLNAKCELSENFEYLSINNSENLYSANYILQNFLRESMGTPEDIKSTDTLSTSIVDIAFRTPYFRSQLSVSDPRSIGAETSSHSGGSAGGGKKAQFTSRPVIEDYQLPLRYRRQPLDEKEIAYINTIRNNAQLSSEICENENPIKCRKVEGIQRRVAAANEVCDFIFTQANTRFQFIDYLILSSLLCQEKFECYKSSFPGNDLNVCVKLSPMFDKDKLKTELTVLYQRQEFRNISDAVKLLQFLLSENLQASFSEVVELLRIAITIPMTTSEAERCFSCLKRVKS